MRKLFLETMSTKKSSGISFSWKCSTPEEKEEGRGERGRVSLSVSQSVGASLMKQVKRSVWSERALSLMHSSLTSSFQCSNPSYAAPDTHTQTNNT